MNEETELTKRAREALAVLPQNVRDYVAFGFPRAARASATMRAAKKAGLAHLARAAGWTCCVPTMLGREVARLLAEESQ